MTLEEWRPVVGYEGLYEVSSHGDVRALEKKELMYNGHYRIRKARTVTVRNRNGYWAASLSKNAKVKTLSVHRMVLAAFSGQSDLYVNHVDGNKRNNHLSNLEWTTPRQNAQHAASLGLMAGPRGERQGSSKLTERDVRRIIGLRKAGLQIPVIAKIEKLSKGHVSNIVNRKVWSHLEIEEPT